MNDILDRAKFEDGKLYIQRTQDVEPLLDEIHELRSFNPTGYSPSRNWRKIGSIPLVMVEDYLRRGINLMDGSPESQREIRKFFNEHSKLRAVDKPL